MISVKDEETQRTPNKLKRDPKRFRRRRSEKARKLLEDKPALCKTHEKAG
jgi:hypothetical protein